MPLARAMTTLARDRLVFIDDKSVGTAAANGHDILTFAEFLQDDCCEKQVAIAVAEPKVRADIAARIAEKELPLLSVWAEQICVMDDVEVAEGALVSPFVTFTSNIRIGRCFHANLYSCVEHDCVIGDFVTFAPGVRCNGNVKIGDYAYIGAGAVIRQGLEIGAGAVVGMGAVVTKNVAAGTVVAGNPARLLQK